MFCARVYSCFVDDGFGDKVILLDEVGCAQDRYLLNNLDYPTDLMAGQEAHVFKYADRTALYFQVSSKYGIVDIVPIQYCTHAIASTNILLLLYRLIPL